MQLQAEAQKEDFNPRPPRGGRQSGNAKTGPQELFQSTPSARRATDYYVPQFAHLGISIHALREEGDVWTNENA